MQQGGGKSRDMYKHNTPANLNGNMNLTFLNEIHNTSIYKTGQKARGTERGQNVGVGVIGLAVHKAADFGDKRGDCGETAGKSDLDSANGTNGPKVFDIKTAIVQI